MRARATAQVSGTSAIAAATHQTMPEASENPSTRSNAPRASPPRIASASRRRLMGRLSAGRRVRVDDEPMPWNVDLERSFVEAHVEIGNAGIVRNAERLDDPFGEQQCLFAGPVLIGDHQDEITVDAQVELVVG